MKCLQLLTAESAKDRRLLCSGYCLEVLSITVFFSRNQTKACMLLVVRLLKVVSLFGCIDIARSANKLS